MKLSLLLGEKSEMIGRDINISHISSDSRLVCEGDLYAAISGSKVDGHIFIPQALSKGAVAILGNEQARQFSGAVPVVIDPNPRLRLAKMASRLHPGQPEFVAAVTGTNGKTSVAGFARQIWDRMHIRAASLGTLGVEGMGRWPETKLTTPDPILLHKICSELKQQGVNRLVLEASSHGLHQHRLDGLEVKAGAFTNISQDHFDYHGSKEEYFLAKASLFSRLVQKGGSAVLNADIAEFGDLAAIARKRDLEIIDFGYKAERLKIVSNEAHTDGQKIVLNLDGKPFTIQTGLVGTFQAHNLVAAIGLVMAGGVPSYEAAAYLGELRGAPGRMQLVGSNSKNAPAFVDYAHTPDALEKALSALKPHTKNRLIVVFGCGGDRDPLKRPIMGRIVSDLADFAIVTDDNPRNEDPKKIRTQIIEVMDQTKCTQIGDRQQAILEGLRLAREGDTLLVAGKGHEVGQIVKGETHAFDDAEVIRQVIMVPEAER